ncbi:hypothetical protein GYB59_22675 [bacterium]|nr:hypothetical protein [bacterium]
MVLRWKSLAKRTAQRAGFEIQHISYRRRAKLLGLPSLNSSDTFMCSYPRSGNTWTRFIIACLLDDSIQSVDLDVIDDVVPDVGTLPRHNRPVRVFKDHQPRFHLFPKVIYNVRDGRDALVSAHRYATKALDYDKSLLDFICDRNAQVFGFWHEHISSALSWAATHPSQFLLVRYEDLKANPEDEIMRIARFLDCPVSSRRAAEIASITSIEKVRRPDPEACRDPRYLHTLGKGLVGQGQQTFSDLEKKVFEGMSGRMLERLGYLESPSTTVIQGQKVQLA